MCQFIRSYLDNRQQAVCVDNHLSSFVKVNAGVPQGSVLGPILFSMFINDLPSTIRLPSNTALFADDTTIYCTGESTDIIASALNSALSSVKSWMRNNGLKLNLSKTKCMLIHQRRSHPPPLNITFNDCCIEQVSTFKLLGVIIDEHLHWSPHVNQTVKGISNNLCLMRRLSWFLPKEALISFYHAYIGSSFNYCSLVWSVCSCTNSKRLQCLQNYAARIILRRSRMSSASEALNILNWKPLTNQREEKFIKLCKQLIQPNSAGTPSYLRLLAEPIASTHSYATRSATRGHLTTRAIRSKYGKKAFSYRMAKAWNASM
jgi:hypothetical protein